MKMRINRGQELVIGGYTDPEGLRTHIGALLVGYYDDGVSHCHGKFNKSRDQADPRRSG